MSNFEHDLNTANAEVRKLRAEAESTAERIACLLDEVANLRTELAASREQIENLQTGRLHTCHENCQRVECRQRRRIAELEKDNDLLRRANSDVRRIALERDAFEEDNRRLDWLEQRMLGAEWGPDSRYTLTEFTAADIRQHGLRATVDRYMGAKP